MLHSKALRVARQNTRDRIVVYNTNSSAGNGRMSTPTEQAYSELQHAYDVFNTRLFAGQLPSCLITIQRKNRTYGYFSGERWNDQAGAVTTEEVLSTLAHEMVHLWQHHCGTPSRSTYHNK